jgi:hypothetical protein
MIQRAFALLIALQLAMTVGYGGAFGQESRIRVMVADGDAFSKEEIGAVLSNIQAEYNQLERQIRAMTVSSDPLSILAGQLVGEAMTRVVAVKPRAGAVRMIGIVGQHGGPEGPLMVLYDISGWIDRGRPLDSPQSFTAIDSIPDAAMRKEGGRKFKFENVEYAAAWVGDKFRIERVAEK